MNPRLMRVAVLALTFFPAVSSAQITTVISAPKRPQATVEAAARREAASQDSIARVTMTGMKEWVDSAANALALRPDTGVTVADTTAVAVTPPKRADSASATRRPTATAPDPFRDGARAPNTATLWPTIAAAGLGLIAAGALMRRRVAPERSSRRP